ncbi:GNAT family N-acetyltransferase, partial [Iodobacter sp. LRB]|uniref:GNAT family N-acetyltransferase n=1 Tax=Iodobacter sp. LRB TaxID=3127955 RepID=UPI00307DE266
EQWDLGKEDESHFFNVDQHGFFMGFLDGVPVSAISIVNFDDHYAHLGHYLVAPSVRGNGLGLRLWETAISHAGERTIALDGMPVQAGNYEKWGFKTHYRTLRLSGILTHRPQQQEISEAVTHSNINEVIHYDHTCVGVLRERLLSNWFQGAGRMGILTRDSSAINGLIGVRRSSAGYRLGPFYAENDYVMNTLFNGALAEIPLGSRITLDVPETATDIIRMAGDYGLKEIFHTFRMYRGHAPKELVSHIKAITSLELS